MFDFIFSQIFRRSFACERPVRKWVVGVSVQGHPFVFAGWAVGMVHQPPRRRSLLLAGAAPGRGPGRRRTALHELEHHKPRNPNK